MSALAELEIGPDDFLLGQVLPTAPAVEYRLEPLIPLGQEAVTICLRVEGEVPASFVADLRARAAVEKVFRAGEQQGDPVYIVKWHAGDCPFFRWVHYFDGHIHGATRRDGSWRFSLHFPSHDLLSAFHDSLRETDVDVEVASVGRPFEVDDATDAVLSERQREALFLAVDAGYYDIPRSTSTSALAAQFDISDQAMTERLRRAITNLVEEVRDRDRQAKRL